VKTCKKTNASKEVSARENL